MKKEELRTKIGLEPSANVVIKNRRLKWLGHVLRMAEHRMPNASLEFEKGESWKRPPGGTRTTWRQLVRNDLERYLKPQKMAKKIWEKNWFDICKETAGNRLQWRALVRDVAG